MPGGAYSQPVLNRCAEGDVPMFKPLRPVMSMFNVP